MLQRLSFLHYLISSKSKNEINTLLVNGAGQLTVTSADIGIDKYIQKIFREVKKKTQP
jgi:phage terminase large subunit-like protein